MNVISWLKTLSYGVVMAAFLGASAANAEEGAKEGSEGGNGGTFGLAFTIGEGVYFLDGDAYRGPVSLELVPSFGWTWFKFDLGLSTTLESVEMAGTNIGHWNFTFRPGARLTPPIIPLYLRFAIPLQFQSDDFDTGMLFGVGVDIPLFGVLGLVLEVDTAVTKNLEWGGRGVPLEFRAGVSFAF